MESLRLILPVYTKLGILSIKFNGNSWEISKFHTFFNVFKIFIFHIFMFFFSTIIDFRKSVLKFELTEMNSYSILMRVVIFLVNQVTVMSVSFFCWKNFIKRKAALRMTLLMTEIEISDRADKRFKKRWTRHAILLLFFFFVMSTVQYFFLMKMNLLSLTIYPIFIYPYLIHTSFISFLRTFELWFVVYLSDYNDRLKFHFEKVNFTFSDYQEMSKRYQKLYEICKAFNSVFGSSVTMLTADLTIVIVLQVIRNYFNFAVLILNVFQIFLSIRTRIIGYAVASIGIAIPYIFFLLKIASISGRKFAVERKKMFEILSNFHHENKWVSL